MTEDRVEGNSKKDPGLLWACFLNWSYTLERIERNEINGNNLKEN